MQKIYLNYGKLKLSLIVFNFAMIPFIGIIIYEHTKHYFYPFLPALILTGIAFIIALVYKHITKKYYLMNDYGIFDLNGKQIIVITDYKSLQINYHNNRLNVVKILIFINKDETKSNNYLFLSKGEIKKISRFYQLPTTQIYPNLLNSFVDNLKNLSKDDWKSFSLVLGGIILTTLAFISHKYYDHLLLVKIIISIVYFAFTTYQIYFLFYGNEFIYNKGEKIEKIIKISLIITIYIGVIFGLLCLFNIGGKKLPFNLNYFFYACYLSPILLLVCGLIILCLAFS